MCRRNMKLKEYFMIANKETLDNLEIQSIEAIKDFICDHFEDLRVDYDDEYRLICKAPLGAPMFSTKSENSGIPCDMIFLTSTEYTYWCQVIYQFSHEITHCFIYAHNKFEEQKAMWLEESICEAMAYYFLKYFADHWELCELGKVNPNYQIYIYEYLKKQLNCEANQRLTRCENYKELMEINESAQERREDRRYEAICIFEKMTYKDILALLKYKDYILHNEKILNITKYCASYDDNLVVQYLCSIQKQILDVKI